MPTHVQSQDEKNISNQGVREPAAPAVFRISRADRAKTFRWTHHELTYEQFRERFEHHISRDTKDGPCFMPADFLGEQRTTKAVTSVYAAVFDVDHAQSWDNVFAIAEASGHVAFVYTAFSHMKTETHVSADVFWKWLKSVEPDVEPNATGHHTQTRMEAYVADKMAGKVATPFTVEEKMIQTEGGAQIVLTHAPVQKSRVVFPLAAPFVMIENGMTSEMQAAAWKQTYTGIGRSLGLKFDAACNDPARLFYYPSCPTGSEELHRIAILDGEGRTFLDYTKFEKAPLEDLKKLPKAKAKTAQKTKAKATPKVATPPETDATFSRDLVRWKAMYQTFDFGRLLMDKQIAEAAPDDKGVSFVCPFPHSEIGSPDKTLVMRTASDGWRISCLGGSCREIDRDTLEFVQNWLETGELTWADLENTEYGGVALVDADDATDVEQEDAPKKSKSWLRTKLSTDDAYAVAGALLLYEMQTEDEKFGRGAGKQNGAGFNKADAARLSPIIEKWNEKTPLSRGEFNVVKRRVAKYAGTQLLRLLEQLEARVEDVEAILDVMTSDEVSDLPAAYFRDEDDDTEETRIYTAGEKGAVEVCQNFEVRAATLDSKDHHGIGIRFADRRGKSREVFFRQGELAGKGTSWLETLSDEGFESYNDGKLRDLLRRLRTDKVALRVGKPGWHLHNGREEFVLPDSDIEDVVYVGRVEHVARDPNGNLECWKDTAKLAEGNSRLVFALGPVDGFDQDHAARECDEV